MRGDREIFYSSSKQLADGLQELLLKNRKCASITTRFPKEKVWIIDHWGTTKHLQYIVGGYKKNTNIKLRKKSVIKKSYNDFVYCVNVPPHHLIYTRRNGYGMWSGNSGIDDVIYNTAEGTLASENSLVLLISNYTRSEGYFHETFNKNKQYWRNFKERESF